jgi:hypothetical protein
MSAPKKIWLYFQNWALMPFAATAESMAVVYEMILPASSFDIVHKK